MLRLMPYNPNSLRNLAQYRRQQSDNSSPADDGHSSFIPLTGESASDTGAESVESRARLHGSTVGCAPENQLLTRMEPAAAAREMLKQAAPSVAEKLLRLMNTRGVDHRVQLGAIRTALEAAGLLTPQPVQSLPRSPTPDMLVALVALGRALGARVPGMVDGQATDAQIVAPARE